MGTATINFDEAETSYQTALSDSRLAVSETAFKMAKPGYSKSVFDIGVVTQLDSSGSAGGKWTGTATLQRTQHQVKVA